MPSYLLPSLHEALRAGRPHTLITLATAGWFRYLTGKDYAGDPVPVEGPRQDFVDLARQEGEDPRPLLRERDVFGGLLDDPGFVEELHAATELLHAGPREAIQTCLAARAAV
jgi:fructuronate reductase/mannitol 2-dehydrogenase